MKRSFTFMMKLMLLFVVTLGAKAQSVNVPDLESKLITDVAQLYSNQEHNTTKAEGSGNDGDGYAALIDNNAGTYFHTNWSGNRITEKGSHYLQVELASDPGEFAFSYTRRNVVNDHTTKWSVIGFSENNPELAKADGEVLAEVSMPYTSSTETLTSDLIATKGYTVIRFYSEEQYPSTRVYWHAAEFQLHAAKQTSAREIALEKVGEAYATYSANKANFVPGTNPGQYDPAAVEAFLKALSDAEVVDSPEGESLTVEELEAITDAMKTTYEALVKTRVPFAMTIQPGYYYLRTGLGYYTSETTPDTEDPETGEPIPGETITTYHEKALYADGDKAMWGDFDKENVKFLWKIEAVADTAYCYTLTNMAKKYQFSAMGTLAADGKPVSFDFAGVSTQDAYTEGEMTYYNIRFTTDAERSGATYFHQNSHGGGAGKGSNIVGWYHTFDSAAETANASEWVLLPVDETVAEAIINGPATKIAEMIENAASIASETPAQMEIAKDIHTDLNMSTKLITEASQFASPWTQHKWGNPDGGKLEDGVLIDGNGATYWHSEWTDRAGAHGVQYLQISGIDTSIDGVAFQMVRRSASSDHLSKFSVYGVPADKAYVEGDESYKEMTTDECLEEKNGLELLATLTLGNPSSGATAISEPFETKGYSIIRIYEEETKTPSAHICWHAAEIQLYPAKVGPYYKDGTTQYNANKTVAETLEAAIADWTAKGYTADAIATPDEKPFADDYAKLVAAKEAWDAVYVDPAALREALTAAAAATGNVVVGEKVGQYSESNAALTALTSAVAEATAYDKAGKYNAEKSEALIAALATTDLAMACNQPKAGTWYKIKFDSEANYEANGWDKTGAVNANLGNLFDNVVVPANVFEEQLEEVDEPSMGQALRFMNEGDVDDELAAFRFVALGDTAYAIQHVSGYYISPSKTLSLTPAIFDVKGAGLGKVLIRVRNIDGTDQNNGGTPSYLHAQNAGHLLVGWANNTVGSSSALLIEEAESVSGEPSKPELNANPNGLRIMAQAIGWSVNKGQLYEVAGRKVAGEAQTLCFTKVDKAEAGLPYLHVMGNYADEEDEDQIDEDGEPCGEAVEITSDLSVLAPEAGSKNGMHATFAYYWVEPTREDVVVVVAREHYASYYGYKLATTISVDPTGEGPYDSNSNEGCDVSANTGYIVLSEVPVVEGSYDLEITVDGANSETAIQQVADVLNKSNSIYTIDGRYVGKGSVKGLSRGIYVIGGVKVAVK